MKKAVLIVLDSVGAGALPDAADYGDAGTNTLGHVYESGYLHVPNMIGMGLGHIPGIGIPAAEGAVGAYGRCAERSRGKDTTTGHWEIAGVTLDRAFPTYPEGFPPEVISEFEGLIGRKVIGNKPASGTVILDELGEEHLRTGYPIVYTSADSVFQIACNEEIIPVEQLYDYCKTARKMLQGEHAVGRVIARPFIGREKGHFKRTPGRKDFSLEPVADTLLDVLSRRGKDVWGVGKIEDIFAERGLTRSVHSAGNPACIASTLEYLKEPFDGLLFVNLVDTDMIYGHRRDVKGYAEALNEFDRVLPEMMGMLSPEDLLIITADHGCDPTHTGTDHTREYIPLLCRTGKMKAAVDLGTRSTFADIAATVCEYFGLDERFGARSFLSELGGA